MLVNAMREVVIDNEMLFTIRGSGEMNVSVMRWGLLLALVPGLVLAHGMSEAERQAIITAGNWGYLSLGTTHMLTGYDHLLFVFGIIFSLSRLLDIVKVVTAFTLGHSVTLIAATLNGWVVNYYLIDAVIGLSVSYIAFANLDGFRRWLDIEPPNLMKMIIVLGLIHGLGLSARLQQLPLNQEALLLNIISFNIGIEFGQLIALLLMVMVLAVWRRKGEGALFHRLSNVGLIAVGVLLFLMQLHGYQHQSDPDEFGFSEDLHHHAHEEMASAAAEPYQVVDGVLVQNPALQLDREGIAAVAMEERNRLVAAGRITSVWREAKLVSVESLAYDGEQEWRVVLERAGSAERLQMTLDFDGSFIAAKVE